MVECLVYTEKVKGSIPLLSNKFVSLGGNGRHDRLKICFSFESIGSSPIAKSCSRVVQKVEYWSPKSMIKGSSPFSCVF